jgi:hypothetical protein
MLIECLNLPSNTDLRYFRVAIDDFGGTDFSMSLESFVCSKEDENKGSLGNLCL